MKALYDRFRDLLHEVARFGVVGLVGLVVTDSGANLLQYGAGVDRFSATVVATIAATALSFAASRYWTFRHRQRSGAGRETVLFFAVNGIGVAITEGCVEIAAAFGLTVSSLTTPPCSVASAWRPCSATGHTRDGSGRLLRLHLAR